MTSCPPDPAQPRTIRVRRYSARIVGEQYHAAAVNACRVGQAVTLQHEIGNPADSHALAVVSICDDVLGYIPTDNWLRSAVMDRGQGASGRIVGFFDSPAGFRKINVEISMDDTSIGQRQWRAPAHDHTDRDARMMPLVLGLLLVVIAAVGWIGINALG